MEAQLLRLKQRLADQRVSDVTDAAIFIHATYKDNKRSEISTYLTGKHR